MPIVKCPRCARPNPDANSFCVSCGSPLSGLADEAAEVGGESSSTAEITSQLAGIRKALSRLTERVIALETAATSSSDRAQDVVSGAAPKPASGKLAWPPVAWGDEVPVDMLFTAEPEGTPAELRPASANAETGSVAAVDETKTPSPAIPANVSEHPGGGGATASAAGGSSSPTAGDDRGKWLDRFADLEIDWERVLGRNWFAIVGSVALAIGIGFFLGLAFQNNWIGPSGRVVLGIIAGAGLLGAGEWTARRYGVWSRAVTGGGLAVFYLSFYSTVGFFDPQLLDELPAFLLLGATVLASGLLALRYESLTIALLSIGGAFLTPILLGRQLDGSERWIVMVYILVVDAGILGLATFRNWRWVTLLGLVASYGLLGVWVNQVPAAERIGAEIGLTGVFLIFAASTTIFHILWRRVPRPEDMALMTINAMAYFGITYGLLWSRYEVWFGLITLSLSLLYGMIGYLAIRRSGAPPQIALYSLSTALVFLTVAVPLQLSGNWITVAWAAEGTVLIYVGFVLGSWRTRAFALAVTAVAVGRLLIFDTPVDLKAFFPVLNERFPTFVAGIAALYVGVWLFRANRRQAKRWEAELPLILAAAASFLTLWMVSAEVISYFDSKALQITADSVQRQENLKLVSLTAAWTLYGLAILAIGIRARYAVAEWAGLGLLAIAAAKLLFFDTFQVRLHPSSFYLGINVYFLTAALVVVAVILAAVMLRRGSKATRLVPYLYVGLLAAGNFILLWGMSLEALRYFDALDWAARIGADDTRALRLLDAKNGLHLSLTALWTAYSAVLLIVAYWKRSSELRWAGIALLSVAAVKAIAWDTVNVHLNPTGFTPVLNFQFMTGAMVLGVAALTAAFYYRRRWELPEWERTIPQAALAATNAFAVALLSMEAVRYFDAREWQAYQLTSASARAFGLADASNGLQLSLTALWSVYAVGLLTVAFVKRSELLRWAGVTLLAAAAFKAFVYDPSTVHLAPSGFDAVLNAQFLTGVLVLAGSAVATVFYIRRNPMLHERERVLSVVFLVATNVMAVWLLSAEAVRYTGAREAVLHQSFDSARHLALTVLWAVYAVGVIAAGGVARNVRMRQAGMLFLGLPVLKLFAFDVFQLESAYRVAAFVTLGALLLGTGFAYQRYSREIKGFIFARAS